MMELIKWILEKVNSFRSLRAKTRRGRSPESQAFRLSSFYFLKPIYIFCNAGTETPELKLG